MSGPDAFSLAEGEATIRLRAGKLHSGPLLMQFARLKSS
jgi:hypothetical protein